MPREHRKRGKKHKKHVEGSQGKAIIEEEHAEQVNTNHDQAGPSWIVQGHGHEETEVNTETPFGCVDPDVKAYFRTVDEKLKEWQDIRPNDEDGESEDVDPNEGKFLVN